MRDEAVVAGDDGLGPGIIEMTPEKAMGWRPDRRPQLAGGEPLFIEFALVSLR